MIYLDHEIIHMKSLLKSKPRLKERVLSPLNIRCSATIEDILRLRNRLEEEYKPFQPYDDDSIMRGFVNRALKTLSYYEDQNMSYEAREYLRQTMKSAEKMDGLVDYKQSQLFSIIMRNLLILYSNYNSNAEFFDLKTSTITYKSVSEMCGIQISAIYNRRESNYECNMYDPEILAAWTIKNGLPVHFTYTIDDPAYKGIKKILNGSPQIQKDKQIEAKDCNVVQFFYCAVLVGLNTMLEGSRNG